DCFSMTPEALRKLLQQVRRGTLSPEDAVERLRHLPFEDLGFAKVDHHRALRAGAPEVVFGPGKTAQQLAAIFARLAQHGTNVLATRVTEEQFAAVRERLPRLSITRWRAQSPCGSSARKSVKARSSSYRQEPAISQWRRRRCSPRM